MSAIFALFPAPGKPACYNRAMPPMVAIDIETTGLDPARDAIIEIAAVRFNGHRVEAEWSTLVNPGKPIPAFITQLTGITNEMVRNAPNLQDVLQEFADFVGDDPVVGHNVRFDLSFLQRNKILQESTMSSIPMNWLPSPCPRNSRYNLGTLGITLGSIIPNSHRALDDCPPDPCRAARPLREAPRAPH